MIWAKESLPWLKHICKRCTVLLWFSLHAITPSVPKYFTDYKTSPDNTISFHGSLMRLSENGKLCQLSTWRWRRDHQRTGDQIDVCFNESNSAEWWWNGALWRPFKASAVTSVQMRCLNRKFDSPTLYQLLEASLIWRFSINWTNSTNICFYNWMEQFFLNLRLILLFCINAES